MATKHTFFCILNKIISKNVYKGARKHLSEKEVGRSTQQRRAQVIRQCFKQLFELGYKIKDPGNFREKHVRILMEKWVEEGRSASTIQGRLSALRTFSSWINKKGMIKSAEDYVDDPEKVKRSTVAQTDKTWSGKNINIIEKIQEVIAYDKNIGVQLLLAYTFALRSREAWMLKPHLAVDGNWLRITRGPKGGKERSFPLRHHYEFEVLEIAKTVAGSKGASMVPASYTLARWKDRYYRILRKFGIGRHSKIVAHGLRHERLNIEYYDMTGFWMTIKGGKKGEVDYILDEAAREHVANIAGHSRNEIVSAYGGSKKRLPKKIG